MGEQHSIWLSLLTKNASFLHNPPFPYLTIQGNLLVSPPSARHSVTGVYFELRVCCSHHILNALLNIDFAVFAYVLFFCHPLVTALRKRVSDLYALFEAVRGLTSIPQISERRRFALARDLLLLPENGGCSTILRSTYERYCAPIFDLLESSVEKSYSATDLTDISHRWIFDRLKFTGKNGTVTGSISDRCETFHESKSVDPEAREEQAFLNLPESVQAVIRARLKEGSLEVGERCHSLFKSDESDLVLLDIRNHIIRMWYRDTRTRLGVYPALSELPSRFHVLGSRIFTYLECTGVINFGAVSVMSPVIIRQAKEARSSRKIAVVGAGMAGLIAARQLRSFGFSVTIFEARKRPGGRVHTERDKLSTAVDMGAMLITGVLQNPVAVLAHQTRSPMHFMDSHCPLFDIDGSWVSREADAWAEKEYNAILDATNRYRMRESSALKATKMSLGQAFQRALEKRVLRRKARIRAHLSGARKALEKNSSKNWTTDDTNFLHIRRRKQVVGGNALQLSMVKSLAYSTNRTQSAELCATVSETRSPRKRQKMEIGLKGKEFSSSEERLSVEAVGTEDITCKTRPLDEKLVSRLLRWHIANLEYACAADIDKVSLVHWDQDDPYGFLGEHVLLKQGYGPLVDGLVNGLERNLRYGWKVTSVDYSAVDGPVQLTAESTSSRSETYSYDSVLITVPLGVLKRGSIRFEPSLPRNKQEAITRLGFGGLMKVAMEFPQQFWVKHDMFGALRESVSKRGQFYFFWNLVPCTSKPVLVGVVAEPSVKVMEELPDYKIVQEALMVLRRRYPQAPDPIAYSISRWSRDEFTGGSYTNIPVGSSGDDYDIIATPVGKSLFFGGEHTCRQYPTTCASAIISGLREANRILEACGIVESIASIYASCLPSTQSTSRY